MPTGTQDGRRRLYLDFDGYFAAVEEQASPARRAVRMRMPRHDVVAAAGTGEKDGQRAFQVFAIGLTIGVRPARMYPRSPRWRTNHEGAGAQNPLPVEYPSSRVHGKRPICKEKENP